MVNRFIKAIFARNISKMGLYQSILKPIFFQFDPEEVHTFAMQWLEKLSKNSFSSSILNEFLKYDAGGLETKSGSLTFKHPLGLGAGFDKNAKYLKSLEILGFSHVEVGTITPKPQKGNEKPRLFRLSKDQALINRMGFNNDGAEMIKSKLDKYERKQMLLGGNIGKNKDTPNQNAWMDYVLCLNILHESVDYFTINVSSPNTPGLRQLLEKEFLGQILYEVQNANSVKGNKDIYLKISPDMDPNALEAIVELAMQNKLTGIIATNTSVSRNLQHVSANEIEKIGAGGLSGSPISDMSESVLKHLMHLSSGNLQFISSGGVMNPEDVKTRLDLGAKLVQLYTGFVYYGPTIVKDSINLLKKQKPDKN